MNSKDYALKACGKCGREKHHKRAGKNLVGFFYVDENGKRWNGSACNDCHRIQMAMNAREKYNYNKEWK